ncbi:prepilin-type N-terminal cleavage/methylation domain-containing protein [Methylomarinum sp. Ch1-1]|uniref:Prepilin-type N-terminal cleavage/methylation domain-containing protein n=1 Tax=Methylomarinum roseum TaxID=3067653 RepID=A0AAU7NVN5_9GAMM|nr:prepilin-type N-terminal cleavage/methylation domain-containing protein [Methylomarinum sp. Ch1-1]MDP4522960.1 prepilin-type N-terminal cleavage/methylation domain-containing protein [Methylomarinum sp. Ch1-1]
MTVRPPKAVGFTLIEVMLAMTLLSIMVVLLFSSLRIGAESWNAGESKIASVNEKAVVYQFFKRHLPGIRPLWDDFSEQEPSFSFQGRRERMQFVSVLPVSAAHKGLQLFEIGIDPRDRDVIMVKLKPFYPTEEDAQWRQEEVVLLEHVREFELSYYSQDLGNGIWLDSWQDKESLPALIKIKITLDDQSYWPEMTFALRLAGAAGDKL